jgi:hypothetical protein
MDAAFDYCRRIIDDMELAHGGIREGGRLFVSRAACRR